jgi:hypothetical protein
MPPIVGDAGNSLRPRLQYAWVQPTWLARTPSVCDLIGGRDAAFVNAPTWKGRKSQWFLNTVSGSNQYANAGVPNAIKGATKISIFATGRFALGERWHVGCGNVVGDRACLLLIDGELYPIFENGSAYTPGAGIQPGPFSAGATYDGTLATAFDRTKLWINGRQVSLLHTGAGPPTSVTTTPGDWLIGRHGSYGGVPTTAEYGVCYVWIGRALSGSDYRRLHVDPFAPLRSYNESAGSFDSEAIGSGAIAAILQHYKNMRGH